MERVFKSDEDEIELEISTHNPMPIYEMHKRLSQQDYQQPTESQRIILPPPIASNTAMSNGSSLNSRLGLFNFLSNSDDVRVQNHYILSNQFYPNSNHYYNLEMVRLIDRGYVLL